MKGAIGVFENGSLVVYGVSGVCRMEEKRSVDLGLGEKDYYILSPLTSCASKIYVPVANLKLVAKIYPALTKKEIADIMNAPCDPLDVWDDDHAVRKEMIKNILEGGDRMLQVRLLRTLAKKKNERESEGKKMWAYEENAMIRAEKNLCDEFCAVCGFDAQAVKDFIEG